MAVWFLLWWLALKCWMQKRCHRFNCVLAYFGNFVSLCDELSLLQRLVFPGAKTAVVASGRASASVEGGSKATDVSTLLQLLSPPPSTSLVSTEGRVKMGALATS